MSEYLVKKLDHPVDCNVEVPGSKSMTNRALLMAALSSGRCRLDGVLFSDDSRHFMSCLESLGFSTQINEEEKYAVIEGTGGRIPNKKGCINVGSAGTAARFLTAMLALSDGEYEIQASEQMKKRPMKPLFDALTDMGAQFKFLEKEGFLPVMVKGRNVSSLVNSKKDMPCVNIDISRSTQFLSALMMTAVMTGSGLRIHITSEKCDGSYIRITSRMMEQFGCSVEHDGHEYIIPASGSYRLSHYQIEPDVSAACYFYAAAAITGGRTLVKNVHMDSMQGDMKFLGLLEEIGCKVADMEEGIEVCGPSDGIYDGIEVNMNDFSDQSMTMAAVAAYAKTPTYITGIGHIRHQESDRIKGIVNELNGLGGCVCEEESAIKIIPKKLHGGHVRTYDDHRMAMSFALIGLKTDGVVIDDYMCCRKTFENYFDVFSTL